MKKVSLVKVSGLCAVLYGVIWVGAIVIAAAATPFQPADDQGQFLLQIDANRTAYLVVARLQVIAGIVGLPIALGLYQALRRWGALLWVGVLALVMGVLFFMAVSIKEMAVAYELAPFYVEASEATRPALEVMGGTLYQAGLFVDLIGHLLIFGIGIGLFSLAVLRTSVGPQWVGWLGLFGAVVGGWVSILTLPVIVGWFVVPQPYIAVAGGLMGIGMLAAFAWLVVMGVVMLRLEEAGTVAAEA